MSEQWYYAKHGQQLGPVAADVIRQMAATGQLSPADLVWKDGMPEWTPARSVPGLFAAPSAYVPVSGQEVEGYQLAPEAPRRPEPVLPRTYGGEEEWPEPRRRAPPRGNPALLWLGVGGAVVLVIVVVVLLVIFLQPGNPRSFNIQAGEMKVFHIPFQQGVKAEIWITSRNNTDIDVFVYDPLGNKVAWDTRFDKDCYVPFVPQHTGTYKVEVVNINRGGILPVGPNHCTMKWSPP
jgi:hypothetical protein